MQLNSIDNSVQWFSLTGPKDLLQELHEHATFLLNQKTISDHKQKAASIDAVVHFLRSIQKDTSFL